jgi:polysaccharide chain length determinant protein (PEP-CTERM system associated)
MSVEFRQRTPSEYGRILWKRKWLIVLPALAVFSAVAIVVWRLPNVYESTTLLIVKPPTIPNAIVPSLSESDLSLRLNNINQVVQSRSSLEPLVLKYDLYKRERATAEPMESVVDKMRKDIAVVIEHGNNDNVPSFRISYKEREPRVTQAVTSELASKYVNAQAEGTQRAGEQTTQFFDDQLEQAKRQLDEIDHRRLEYMQKNVGHLPSEAASLLAQLNGLREQQKALISEIGRLQDRRSALSSQITLLSKQTDQELIDVAENTTDPRNSLPYAELMKRKSELSAELQDMKETLKPKNPDVIKKQAQLDSVVREMDLMNSEWKARIEEKRVKLANRVNLPVAGSQAELKLTENELGRQQGLLAQTEGQINDLNTRINNVPGAEVGLTALEREYQTSKSYYDQLLEKRQKAALGAAVDSKQQGETIQVVDPANLPASPVAPKRLIISGGGLAVGLVIGLLLTALCEVPRLLTIQTSDDAEHYSKLPVFASLPNFRTPYEAKMIPIRRAGWLVAGIIAAIVSVPVIAVALRMSRVFERFLS